MGTLQGILECLGSRNVMQDEGLAGGDHAALPEAEAAEAASPSPVDEAGYCRGLNSYLYYCGGSLL